MDEEMLILMWETVREYIPTKDIQLAADHVIADLVDNGLDDETLKAFNGLDKYMTEAVAEHIDEEVTGDDEVEWSDEY